MDDWDWNEMKKFHRGKTEDGKDRFSISLKADEDGLVGRECSQTECEPKYFKITTDLNKEGEASQEFLWCPYCGFKDGLQQFITESQLEWVKSMIFKDVAASFQRMLGSTLRSSSSSQNSFIKLTYKPGALPSVRHYAEKELKRILSCDVCGKQYAVYGISMYCPLCSAKNLGLHLRKSVEIILSLLNSHEEITSKYGVQVGDHLLGNCLEDCVSLMEGFLKVIYKDKLPNYFNEEECAEKISRLRNSFQQLSKAEEIFKNDLNVELFLSASKEDVAFLKLQFAKRHVITHNLGLVDEKFKSQMLTWQTKGQEIKLEQKEIENTIKLVESTLTNLI